VEKRKSNGKVCAYMRCWAYYLLIALFSVNGVLAAGNDEAAFQGAAQALRDKFYERAENQFGAFVTNFPSSTNLSRAILFQAQARHFQKNHDAAVELLRSHFEKAGPIADQYVLTWAEALAAKGDHSGAAEQFGRILKEFPQSSLRLQAAYLQAFSFYQQKNHVRTIELLGPPESEFKKLAANAPQDRFSFAGELLLAEALLSSGKLAEARNVAAALPSIQERPEWQWEKLDALARIELAGTNFQSAFSFITNAASIAEQAQRPRLQAQSINLEAEYHRKSGQPANAVSSYEKIAAIQALPIDQRRLAVLKTVEIHSSAGDYTNAIRRLETYLSAMTNEPAADLLSLKAGELWIDFGRILVRGGAPTGSALAAVTNALFKARGHLNTIVTQFTNSTHLGRAHFHLGWSYWEEASLTGEAATFRMAEKEFRTATEKLARSNEQGVALFKLADAQLTLGEPRQAITNFTRLLSEFGDLPDVKRTVFDNAYAQLVRANVQLGDYVAAEKSLAELRSNFPSGDTTEEAIHHFGHALLNKGESQKARGLFQDFVAQYPASVLAADVRFAEARTFGIDGDFTAALERHEAWLRSYTNHQLQAEVEFQKGVLLDKAGKATNAFSVFTNFVASYPTNTLAPAAQMWVADYFLAQDQLLRAEQSFQRIFQNTNWSSRPVAYEARMMAARTAFRRQGYADARSYLTNLVNDPKCPAELRPEAWFALGDIFMEEPITGSTNALHNFVQAAAVFERIATQFPTNEIAVLATAKKGDCYFQMASHTNYVESYSIASNAYATVLTSTASVSAKVRNQAEFGLARVLERMADGRVEKERQTLRKSARDHYLNIIYGDLEGPQRSDPFYMKLAGREAGRLSEELGEREAAIALYQRLTESVPAAKALWQSRLTALRATQEKAL
jgi:TolA-binding protein